MKEAKRDNQNKPRLSLVPPAMMKACSRAMMYGIEKYGIHNWRDGGKHMSYHGLCDSLLRHVFDLLDGKDFDDESGLHQIDHICANVAFIAEMIQTGKIVEDRYFETEEGNPTKYDEPAEKRLMGYWLDKKLPNVYNKV